MKLSVTGRIRLLNATLSLVILGALLVLAQVRIRAVLYGAVDRTLRDQAQRFGEPRRDDPRRPEPPHERRDFFEHREPPRLDFGTIALLPPRRFEPGSTITREGKPVWSRSGLEAARRTGEDLREDTTADGEHIHVFSRRTPEGIIQTAASTVPTDAALVEIGQALTILAFPLALLSAFLGALFTDIALAPVGKLARSAAALDPSNLAARLPAPGGSDTFDSLVTTLNGMLGRIEAAFDRQKRFASDASHELRTPLAVIKASTSFLLEQPESLSGVAQRTLTRVDKTTDRATRLVTDLLFLARSENEGLPFRPQEMVVAALIDEVLADAQLTAAMPHAPLQRVCPDDLVVSLDPDLMHRLLLNLVENALRYTPADGAVTVTATPDGFTVTDTGVGIPAEAIVRLGEPFFRPDESRARTQGGAGLGLAICKSIAAAHGGVLEIQSQEGVGTSVWVKITAV